MTSRPIYGFAFRLMARIILFSVPLMSVSGAQAQVSIGNDGVAFPDGTLQTTGIPGTYAIGDIGPAGGFVFYVTADGLHGLEAASADQATEADWGCFGTNIPGAEGTTIGTGERNTEEITPYACPDDEIAALWAAEHVSASGYFDWYLPSTDELDLMYDNIGPGNATNSNVGGFAADNYWSSSENSSDRAAAQGFSNGLQFFALKWSTARVRAIRAF